MYTFKDKHSTIHVYKHHDGYPQGAIEFINNAIPYAWGLPRFEPDDFAAAFVSANKSGGGGVRLCGNDVKEPWDFSCDSDYWYVVSMKDNKLMVTIHEVAWWEESKVSTQIFTGPLTDAIKEYL
jgi:hypothetical protein